MKRLFAIGIFVFLVIILPVVFQKPQTNAAATVISGMSINEAKDFNKAILPRNFQFPLDYGPHPDFQTEWWYTTGNLDTPDGQHFGYELTIFRRGLIPPKDYSARASDLATNQIYMAHFALTDVKQNQFHSFEQFERGVDGLAGATVDPVLKVWVRDWQIQQTNATTFTLKATENGIAIDFTLEDVKGPILEGNNGLSQKGTETGNASYYYSHPRLTTSGTIEIDGKIINISGLSWMDHEFSTSALGKDQIGWDWFSIQMDDKSELMLYALRKADGSIDSVSSGNYIRPDGSSILLAGKDFEIANIGQWASPGSGAVYPSGWNISIPKLNLNLTITPWINNQELRLSFTYWEGAVRVIGNKDNLTIKGNGYVELTGYAQSMQGQF